MIERARHEYVFELRHNVIWLPSKYDALAWEGSDRYDLYCFDGLRVVQLNYWYDGRRGSRKSWVFSPGTPVRSNSEILKHLCERYPWLPERAVNALGWEPRG